MDGSPLQRGRAACSAYQSDSRESNSADNDKRFLWYMCPQKHTPIYKHIDIEGECVLDDEDCSRL